MFRSMRSHRRRLAGPSTLGGLHRVQIAALLATALGLGIALGSCSSVSFQRETETSGTFQATGWSFTLLSVDLPKSALNIARENASDAKLPNTVVRDVTTGPYLGALDFLLDILCLRYARIEGTWGFSGNEARERDEFDGL
jgi:hypothetical protein